ncbi:VanZ family protein [bacterium]|nr:VanZ family protein [bacterium]MBU1958733.1 VanZ family protein [bacterium]
MSIFSLPKQYYKILFYSAVLIVLYLAIVPDNISIPSIYADKIKHASAFFVLSFLLNRASSTMQHRLRNMGALFLFGLFIEIVQSFFPNRESSLADLLADAVGILLFQLLYSLFKFIRDKIEKNS